MELKKFYLIQLIDSIYINTKKSKKQRSCFINSLDFNLKLIYDYIKNDSTNNLTAFELKEQLKGTKFYYSIDEINVFLQIFSSNKQSWNFYDFKQYLYKDIAIDATEIYTKVKNNILYSKMSKMSMLRQEYYSQSILPHNDVIKNLLSVIAFDISFIKDVQRLLYKIDNKSPSLFIYSVLTNNPITQSVVYYRTITLHDISMIIYKYNQDFNSEEKALTFLSIFKPDQGTDYEMTISFKSISSITDILCSNRKGNLDYRTMELPVEVKVSKSVNIQSKPSLRHQDESKDKYNDIFIYLINSLIQAEHRISKIKSHVDIEEIDTDKIYLHFINKSSFYTDYLDMYSIYQGLLKVNVKVDNLEDILMIIKKYDTSETNKLYYRDFVYMINPNYSEHNKSDFISSTSEYNRYSRFPLHISYESKLNSEYYNNLLLPQKTRDYLKTLFDQILYSERHIQCLIRKIADLADFDYKYYFKKISYLYKSTSEAIMSYLSLHDIKVVKEDIDTVIYRLTKGKSHEVDLGDFVGLFKINE